MAGIITNLADDLTWSTGCCYALLGEQQRRQRDAAGGRQHDSVRDYQCGGRPAGDDRPRPLPHLLVIVDEFCELLSAVPTSSTSSCDRRVGRSIGAPVAGHPAPGGGHACGVWSRTCPTGCACAPSARPRAGRRSASPTPTTCRRARGGYLKVTPLCSSGSRPRWSPPRTPRRTRRPRRGAGGAVPRHRNGLGGWLASQAEASAPAKRTSLSSRTRRGRGSGRSWMWRWSDWPPPVRPGPSGVAGPTTGDPSAGHGAGSAGPRRRRSGGHARPGRRPEPAAAVPARVGLQRRRRQPARPGRAAIRQEHPAPHHDLLDGAAVRPG